MLFNITYTVFLVYAIKSDVLQVVKYNVIPFSRQQSGA